MTGNKVPFGYLPQYRPILTAPLAGLRTPGMKTTTGRRIAWTWHLSFQVNPIRLSLLVHLRNRRKQRFRIRMITLLVELVIGRNLNHIAKIHHSHPVADLIYYIQIIRNKEVIKS